MDRQIYSFTEQNLKIAHSFHPCPPRDLVTTHTHNVYEILYIVEGDVTHVIEDRRYKLRPGDLVFIRPLHYHFIQFDSQKPYHRFQLLFDENEIPFDLSRISASLDVVNIAELPRLSDTFSKLDFYTSAFSREDFIKLSRSLILELLYNLSLLDASPHSKAASKPLTDAIAYINDHLFTIKSVGEIADHVFVTEGYLFKLFQKELKKGPKKYLCEKRLLAAQKEILSGKRPAKVYAECGFTDYTAFYRSYVKYFGCSPSKKVRYL